LGYKAIEFYHPCRTIPWVKKH